MEFTQVIFRSLGMTLVHSLWQGAVIAALVLFSLSMVKKTNARARYVILFSGLTLLLASFVVTFTLLYQGNLPNSIWRPVTNLNAANVIPESWSVTPVTLTGSVLEFLEPWYPALAMGWMAGFMLFTLRFAGGAVIARIRFRSHLTLPDPHIQNMFDSLMLHMEIPFKVKLRISYRSISPMVFGILQPLVIIPIAAISGLSTNQIQTVIVHELAHIRRYDHVLIFIQVIARQVLFFHPLTWFLIPEIDRERENCCDDFVIHSIDSPIHYLKALAMIQEMKLNSVPANALTGKRSHQLLSRITRLVKPEMKHSAAFRLAVVSLFVATIGISTMAFIITDTPDVKNSQNSLSVQDALQSDTMDKKNTHGSINFTSEDWDGDKKKMKIIFSDDTITRMTVNGKPISKEEMKQYKEEIRKVQEELRTSQEELRIAHEKLNQAQKELQIAQLNMEGILLPPLAHQFNFGSNMGVYSLPQLNPESFEFDTEKFREEMKRAQDEGMKAFQEAQRNQENWKLNEEEWKKEMEKFRKEAQKHQEYWNLHQEEYNEQMKKAEEEAAKAIEELRKSGIHPEYFRSIPGQDTGRNLHRMPAAPRIPSRSPDVRPEVPNVPQVPEIPDIDIEIENESNSVIESDSHQDEKSEKTDKQLEEEMDNTLREMEEE